MWLRNLPPLLISSRRSGLPSPYDERLRDALKELQSYNMRYAPFWLVNAMLMGKTRGGRFNPLYLERLPGRYI